MLAQIPAALLLLASTGHVLARDRLPVSKEPTSLNIRFVELPPGYENKRPFDVPRSVCHVLATKPGRLGAEIYVATEDPPAPVPVQGPEPQLCRTDAAAPLALDVGFAAQGLQSKLMYQHWCCKSNAADECTLLAQYKTGWAQICVKGSPRRFCVGCQQAGKAVQAILDTCRSNGDKEKAGGSFS